MEEMIDIYDIPADIPDTTPDDAHILDNEITGPEDTTPTAGEQPCVTIKFNHKKSNLSLKEAADIIQKSMYAESSLSKLKFMAASKGVTLPELVNEIFEKNEGEELERLREQYAGDDKGFLDALEKRRTGNEQAFMEMLASEEPEDINRRLADEFIELLDVFPDCTGIYDLPDEVLREAAETGKNLLFCYLLYRQKEQQALEEQKQREEKNRLSSSRSFRSSETAGENPEILAMLKGIRK